MRRRSEQSSSLSSFVLSRSVAVLAVATSACTLIALGLACGDNTGSSAQGGAGGTGSASGGGGDGLPDFVTAIQASSSSNASSGAGGIDAGPTCKPPMPGGATTLAKNYGDASTQSGVAVGVDKQGNILLAGTFQGTINLGGSTLTSGGKDDIFIAKLTSTGQHVWSKSFGDGYNQNATGIAADPDGNIIVTGGFVGNVNFGGGTLTSDTIFFQDVFIAKFGADGTHVWSKRFGDKNIQQPRGLAVDNAGNTIIVGYFQNDVDFGGGTLTSAGLFDAFVAKFNPAGQWQWNKRIGDPSNQQARAVVVDAQNNVYVGGEASGTVDFGSGPLTAEGAPSAFVVKYDQQGTSVWGHVSKGSGMAATHAVAVGPSGAVAAVGSFQGGFDFGGGLLMNPDIDDAWVTMFTAAGAHTYTKRFGDQSLQSVEGAILTANGDVVIAGNFQGIIDLGGGPMTSVDGFDIFVARLDSAGCPVWQRSFGGAGIQSLIGMSTDPTSGNALLTGAFSGSVDFGTGALTAQGDDVFVTAIKP